ncbi:glycoside hydrolase/phage tail family protein [Sulfitobacter sp. D35]|uniref:baseplate multidomain protein megatron n=1 Tax=Sulfitobacter sp. D35 TaxID=3083252 RepID=UPI00296F271C|nr:glycoside hydrolase/phage tail family protein [Sulfitobacter sp. D35]MDW4496807.1 glycoside hydrolase/phage tail family protein [Sulfitobacter sp. D35]
MTTIVLSAAGAAIGGSLGGSVAGLSSVVIGRAIGATIGQVIDQRLLGNGSEVVETGRVDRFRLTGAGEGAAIARIYGRTRIGGQVIWASDFLETSETSGGGKGGPSEPETRSYSYFVSLAVALCEGEITRVGRIWADGEEVSPDGLNLRVYKGTQDQLPDPAMEAVEGAGTVPAYRGTAYVVFENLPLERFGNRVPQFTFEVSRPEQPDAPGAEADPTWSVKGVAMIPGTGEYALATTPVHYSGEPGAAWSANVNSPTGRADFALSLDALGDDLPQMRAVSLVVSWFGDDLRCGNCRIAPKVEKTDYDGQNMPWRVAGLDRAGAALISQVGGRPVYGGTPTDQSVIEAIRAIDAAGHKVLYYPFILMDQLAGNGLTDPYDPSGTQPELPWRGRITTSRAPGVAGSPDGTSDAIDEVDAFFGTVTAADFTVSGEYIAYTGPDEWTFTRFILHNAALCRAAGGVEAFCIGSEMRGLTQIRGPQDRFVAVERLIALAAEVRSLLGPETKLSYAADWSEYFGYQPQDGSGDRFFHLDPLWSDPNIDFIGIDNYMPLSDWRDGDAHLDADAEYVYDLDYLRGNIEGGEGYDWYYHSAEAREAQVRTPIVDDLAGEPWVYRYKDIRNWWTNLHHERVGGIRKANPTGWVPESKPVWFTELGCAAVNRGTNQPNKFLDPKSSESSLPYHSNGLRDDLIQMQYLRAMYSYWTDGQNNPVSSVYGARMLNMSRAFIWAWDARPYPYFPINDELWGDGANYYRGHWLNGRTTARSLASVVAEVCRDAGLVHFDTSRLFGTVRGYAVTDVGDARSALQPLMLRYGFDAVERDGMLSFRMRNGRGAVTLDRDRLALSPELDGVLEQTRSSDSEMTGRVRLRFVQADAEFETTSEESILPDEATHAVAVSEFPLVLTRAEGRQTVERWLAEARVARETLRFAMPLSMTSLGAGDVVRLDADGEEGPALYRIDRVEMGAHQIVEAVRIEPDVYNPADFVDEPARMRRFVAPAPVLPLFMDLPLMSGDEKTHAPHVAVTSRPWQCRIALYRSRGGTNFRLQDKIGRRSTIGVTQSVLQAAPAGIYDRGAPLQVQLISGSLSSVDTQEILSGANLAAIGDGSPDGWELFQFQSAELISKRTYLLRDRLRGQCGSDGVMPVSWPAGSYVVLLDGVPEQIDFRRNLRGVEQHWRIGPARRPLNDPSYVEQVLAFAGNGLRPYRPAHLSALREGNGDLALGWIRRTRIDGDGWDTPEVPLGEENERYAVRVLRNGSVLREVTRSSAGWTYSAADQVSDGAVPPFSVEVAQVSASFGAGPRAVVVVQG